MNIQLALSRRTLLQRSAITGLAVIVATASSSPVSRRVFAQNGAIRMICTSDGVRVRDDAGLSGTILGFVNTGDIVSFLGNSIDADGYTWLNISVVGQNLTGWAASDFFERSDTTTWAPGTAVHVNDDGVNLRRGPGLANGVITTYDNGTGATVVRGPTLANGYQWYEIDVADGTRGWMAADFLTEGPGNGDAGWAAGTRVHINANDVNIRDAPGLSGGIIRTLNENTNASVIGGPQSADGHSWYKLGVAIGDGVSGWVAADFLTEGQVGDPGFPDGAWVWTMTDLHLRSAPGTSSSIVAVYGMHEAATVITGPQAANGFNWYQVEIADDGNVGWMAGEFLGYAPTEPTGSRLRVTDGPLNLREGSDTSATIITTVPTGGVVVVADATSTVNDGFTWRFVYLEVNPDLVGWIATDFTEAIG